MSVSSEACGRLPGLTSRRAAEADLATIVGLLADDVLGASREASTSDALARYQFQRHESGT